MYYFLSPSLSPWRYDNHYYSYPRTFSVNPYFYPYSSYYPTLQTPTHWGPLGWERNHFGYPIGSQQDPTRFIQPGIPPMPGGPSPSEIVGAVPEIAAKTTIESKWNSLNRAPGIPISNLEKIGTGYRIRYQNGTIYTKTTRGPAFWIYGEIEKRWGALQGVQSWLGFPTTDILPIKYDNGYVMSFEKGEIYFWPETGPIEIDQVVLTYKGIHCFGTTSGPGSDEVYATISVVAPTGMVDDPVDVSTALTRLYEDVDRGVSVPDHIELYRGKPYGLNITFILIERDEGDPNAYYQNIHATVSAAAAAGTAAIGAFTTPAGAAVAGPVLQALVTPVSKGINSLLDLGDDIIGQQTIVLSIKEIVLLAAQTGESVLNNQIRFKIETPLLTGEGSSYKGYFSLSRA
ncbi:hypothetical protein U8V97_18460 [Priestia filamentosa]|uniref:LGFP repeat-containing protein n=1 Tax=Priestia filamentosa TaxID=1402861 RepID=UPI00397C441B